MSTNSHGYLVVILPEDKISEFERRFDLTQPDCFPNVEIELCRSAKKVDDASIRQREYTIDCAHSLYLSFVDSYGLEDGISLEEFCKNFGVLQLDVESVNSEDQFREEMHFTKGDTMEYKAEEFYALSFWRSEGWKEEDEEEMC